MANTSSAKKSIRVSEKKRVVNKNRSGRIKTFIKAVESAIESNDHSKAMNAYKTAQPVIQSAYNKNVYSKAKVSRVIKRLNTRIQNLLKK